VQIVIKTIPHAAQRYDTAGDWWFDKDLTLHIRVSVELPTKRALFPEKFAFLVAFHEMIEAMLCLEQHGGDIRKFQERVDKFDMDWTPPKPEVAEPGDDFTAPYYEQHQVASGFERMMAAQLHVCWLEYGKAVDQLSRED